MHFEAKSMAPEDFTKWVADAKASPRALDTAAYSDLAKQSLNDKPALYGSVDPKLFDAIVNDTAPKAQGPADAPRGGG
jgi:cytochrome o ubiquinol oxidase subunit 2